MITTELQQLPDELTPVQPVDSHKGCLMCGNLNPLSMKLKFAADKNSAVHADFKPHEMLQGYRGILHGGVICALLDSAMVNCLFHQNISAVTAEMQVKFIHPVNCGHNLHLRAHIDKTFPPLYTMKAELTCSGEAPPRRQNSCRVIRFKHHQEEKIPIKNYFSAFLKHSLQCIAFT